MRSWKALITFDYGDDGGIARRAEVDWIGTTEEWGVTEEKLESWVALGGYVEEVIES